MFLIVLFRQILTRERDFIIDHFIIVHLFVSLIYLLIGRLIGMFSVSYNDKSISQSLSDFEVFIRSHSLFLCGRLQISLLKKNTTIYIKKIYLFGKQVLVHFSSLYPYSTINIQFNHSSFFPAFFLSN